MGSKWAYKIDYDAEIIKDECEIAYFSSDLAKAVGQAVDELLAVGQEWARGCEMDALLFAKPDLLLLLGLTPEDARVLFAICDYNEDAYNAIVARYGTPQVGDYARGKALWAQICPLGYPWTDWRSHTEAGRLESLRLAKAALSRHKRNKSKNT